MSAPSSPEIIPIDVDGYDSELTEFSDSSAAERNPSSTSASSASSTPTPVLDQYETRLWQHFPGWLWSERSKEIRSWAWEYGYDIQRDDERNGSASDVFRQITPSLPTLFLPAFRTP
jgi:hypothetical protein